VAAEQLVRTFIASAKADSTKRAYRSDWDRFSTWCGTTGHTPLPATPTTVALYLAAQASTRKVSTLTRWVSSINAAHRAYGHPEPGVSTAAIYAETMKGIRRTYGVRRDGKKPLLRDDVVECLSMLGSKSNRDCRDRLLVLFGFSGAFRRSELAALSFEDVKKTEQGLLITVRWSKTDQEGQGRVVGIRPGRSRATCPIEAFEAWSRRIAVKTGPVFRPVRYNDAIAPRGMHPYHLDQALKHAADLAGYDAKDIGMHSLRSGFVTQAYLNGAELKSIMDQTGHKSVKTLFGYIKKASVFTDNASDKLGL
jgi:integrase